MHFCIDRYEYTSAGESLPKNGASSSGAGNVCTGLGERLCTESKWNFACEGEEMRPYPYGFTREPVCTAHDNFFKGLQIGIRCCSNIALR